MAKRRIFKNPDSQEREYIRLLTGYSKKLSANINRILIPRIGDILLQYKVESRADSWADTLAALMAELARIAGDESSIVISRLPSQFEAISKFNEGQFKMVVKSSTGLDLPPVMPGAPASALLGVNVFRSEPFLVPLAEGWISQNVSLIKDIHAKTSNDIEGLIRRGVMNGQSVKSIQSQIKEKYKVSNARAKLIAQDQTLKLNADLTRYRLQSVGVKSYVWSSVKDIRVRPEHADRDGKTFSWDKPPAGGMHPGQEVRCRCAAEAVWDDDEQEEPLTYGNESTMTGAEPAKKARATGESSAHYATTPINIASVSTPSTYVIPTPTAAKKTDPKVASITINKKQQIATAREKIEKHVDTIKLTKPLTETELSYVESYKGDAFQKFNSVLRSPERFSDSEVEQVKKMEKSITSAVNKSKLQKDVTLYRGIRDENFFANAESFIGKDIDILTPQSTSAGESGALSWTGLIKTNSGYLSADPGKSVLYKINATKGQSALDMEKLSIGNTTEGEVLLKSGGKYRVRSVTNLKTPGGAVSGKLIEVDYIED